MKVRNEKSKFSLNKFPKFLGFASYMEHIIVDHIEPAWHSKELFIVNHLHPVFSFDSLISSHKISVEVDNPDQIGEIFDFIS